VKAATPLVMSTTPPSALDGAGVAEATENVATAQAVADRSIDLVLDGVFR
jgi:hypothetical protein